MCGQFAILGSMKAIKDYYNFLISEDLDFFDDDIYNDNIIMNLPNETVKPMDYIPIFSIDNNAKKVFYLSARWGLVPFWAKDESFAMKMINARCETISEKSSFKYAYQKRRCLVPFTGYYEKDSAKKYHYFKNDNDDFLSFAGLYEVWGKDKLITFTIITCEASEKLKKIHNRMPVILNSKNALEWVRGNFNIGVNI
jgi:putative SOS response-associated peptidase YedK